MTPPTTLSAAELSSLDQPAFVAALEGIFEHSPWVAQETWPQRPFADRQAVLEALLATVQAAPRLRQLVLVRAHPELAGKAAVRGELTIESRREQAGAGLAACSPEEFELIQVLNDAYTAKFGFPFIIAVRGLSRSEIITAMRRRLDNSEEDEFREALRQVGRIAELRLMERIVA